MRVWRLTSGQGCERLNSSAPWARAKSSVHTAPVRPFSRGWSRSNSSSDTFSLTRTWRTHTGACRPVAPGTLAEAIEQLKQRTIDDALRDCGTKTRAAERLGLSRQSFQQMLKRRQG